MYKIRKIKSQTFMNDTLLSCKSKQDSQDSHD